jgi:hypothetical protein
MASNSQQTKAMTRDELLPIIAAMNKYGGSFAKALANAMLLADSENLQRLTSAFPDMIQSYFNNFVKTNANLN